MLDGDPAWPDLGWQWRVAEETRPTFMGVSPTFLMACRKAGLEPGRDYDLSSIRVFGTAGSPLPAEGYRYVYEQLGPDVLLINGSGGTDVCSGIVGGSPLLPVYEGEISGRLLGVAADAFDPQGEPIVGELGELVITRPMPSMPVELWGDTDGSLYRSLVLRHVPGVWRQGDWIRFSERGSCVVTGRSDATLNRGGVRLGTGEFYSVVEELPEVTDSLVVHLEDDEGGAGELVLFVVLADGVELDDELRGRIGAQPALAALAAPRSRHDPRGARDPPHADREEARGAGQAHPPRRPGRRRREPGLAPRPDRARPVRRDRGREAPARYRRVAVAEPPLPRGRRRDRRARPRRDVGGGRRLPPRRAARRRREALPRRVGAADGGRARAVLPRAEDDGRRLHGRRGVVHGAGAGAERGDRRGGERERRRADPVREHRPAQGPARRRRGAAPDRRPRRARLQVPPERAGVLPERPPGLPALRGDRGGRAARALPHRALGRRLGAPGRRRHPAQVLEPDARRRRRGRLPDAQDRPRAPVVPVAGRGDLGRAAQAAGLHRPLRLVAEVLPAATRPPREHAAARSGAVRHRLPVHHPRPLARRLRQARHQARGAAADPEAERDPPARAGAEEAA